MPKTTDHFRKYTGNRGHTQKWVQRPCPSTENDTEYIYIGNRGHAQKWEQRPCPKTENNTENIYTGNRGHTQNDRSFLRS